MERQRNGETESKIQRERDREKREKVYRVKITIEQCQFGKTTKLIRGRREKKRKKERKYRKEGIYCMSSKPALFMYVHFIKWFFRIPCGRVKACLVH